ncbi:protein DVR-1 homolog [Anneissia japonica]|uniref:protein DVR-1 homolog n=1 Tax=Anneissia japonica TaxID=1529436 RepID=UPI0014259D6B|nr:protein DVR-1 homolog [Anneissia japonica]
MLVINVTVYHSVYISVQYKPGSVAKHGEYRFYFDVSDVSMDDILTTAELRLFKRFATFSNELSGAYTLTVYQIVHDAYSGVKEKRYLSNQVLSAEYQGWLELDITETSLLWPSLPRGHLELEIIVENFRGEIVSSKDIGIVGISDEDDKEPFVVAFFKTSPETHLRRTRAAKKNKKNKKSGSDSTLSVESAGKSRKGNKARQKECQKRNLFVSFKDLDWQDWIIAPEGYEAFYCYGECAFPLNGHLNATNHAIVQTLVHLMSPKHVPQPCCAPTKLSAISVLFFDESSNVILKKYREMTVKACGCH